LGNSGKPAYNMFMKLRIGIAGVSGRVGRLLVEEVGVAGLTLAGGLSRTAAPDGVTRVSSIGALAASSDLVIDFTHADTVGAHAAALANAGVAWVLGTTGFSAADEAAIATAAARIAILAAPNFSPGVNLMFALAEKLGAALPGLNYDAEILEMHHRQKVDAPSGTALGIGRAVAAGRGVALGDVMVSGRDGHTGPRKDGEIGFAALRGGQIIGRHAVSFTAAAEQISLTHEAFDRRVYAQGAVRAALWLHGRKPGLYSMRDVLGL
jgi:4-hydroxy-tetrahydrodipicolinate reductase